MVDVLVLVAVVVGVDILLLAEDRGVELDPVRHSPPPGRPRRPWACGPGILLPWSPTEPTAGCPVVPGKTRWMPPSSSGLVTSTGEWVRNGERWVVQDRWGSSLTLCPVREGGHQYQEGGSHAVDAGGGPVLVDAWQR
ncbi:MAG: hypothetical protein ACYCTI_03045 [Acidimicrobiales bacterium]